MQMPNQACVLVADGRKMMFLRNEGDAEYPNLVVERVREQDNPSDREQSTDAPGRSFSSTRPGRSAYQETDFHELEEQRFAAEVAEILRKRALANEFESLIIVAPPRTLGELRQSLLEAESRLSGGAHSRVHPFADVRDYGALLQRAGFALPVADREDIVVRYDDIFALMRDLRAMGMTNATTARSRKPAPRALFALANEIYAERFSDADGRIRATFAIVHLSGWTPHESQQKPLKPGSAKMRLADALKTEERNAED